MKKLAWNALPMNDPARLRLWFRQRQQVSPRFAGIASWQVSGFLRLSWSLSAVHCCLNSLPRVMTLWTIALLSVAAPLAFAAPPEMPRYRFENFTTANGLPDNHVFAVLVDGDRVWAGTENGLAVYENHAWKTYTCLLYTSRCV